MRAKPIQVNAPFCGSIEEIRAFAVDRGHSVDFVSLGVLYRFRDGYVVIAGDMVGEVVGEVEEGEKVPGMLLPPLVYRYPKEKPSNMSLNLFWARIIEDAEIRMRDSMEYFGMPIRDDLDLSKFINADTGDQIDDDEQVEAHNMEVEAQNMNQQADTNTWTMSHLDSSPYHHCSTGNSHCRGMPQTNMSMEQLHSSLGDCAMGNCPHCRGY